MRTVTQHRLAFAQTPAADPVVAERIAAIDWENVARSLDAEGHARLHTMLSPEECAYLVAGYKDDAQFRSSPSKSFPANAHDFSQTESSGLSAESV